MLSNKHWYLIHRILNSLEQLCKQISKCEFWVLFQTCSAFHKSCIFCHMFPVIAWKNVVCLELTNKEDNICEILVMLPFVTYLTSDVFSYLKIPHPNESPLK